MCKKGISPVGSALWCWETGLQRSTADSGFCPCALSGTEGTQRSFVLYKPIWSSSVIVQQGCWGQNQKHHSRCWGRPLGGGLNGTGAHSGVCSQPEVNNKGALARLIWEHYWRQKKGPVWYFRIKRPERHMVAGTVTTDHWVPGSAYERTGMTPDDYPQLPSDTEEGWVPV